MAHGYYNLKGAFVKTASLEEATAAWRAERGYDPVGVFDMGDHVVDTRKTSFSKPSPAAAPETPAEASMQDLASTEGSLARYLADEVAAPRMTPRDAAIARREKRGSAQEPTPTLAPEAAGRTRRELEISSRYGRRAPQADLTRVTSPLEAIQALGSYIPYGVTAATTPTAGLGMGALPLSVPPADTGPKPYTEAGPTFYTGDQALDMRIESALAHHEKIGSSLTEEEIKNRVILTAGGFHPDLTDEKGNPVPMVDAVFDPHSEIYNDSEAEDWLRRGAYKQVHRKDMMDVRQEDVEVTGRNITRVMELARMENDDPDHIRTAMPDIMSIEGAMIAAAQQGISIEEFLYLWEYETLDGGSIWQKKEPGGGGVTYAYDAPDPVSASRGRSRTGRSAPYGSASKLAFDWRVRIT